MKRSFNIMCGVVLLCSTLCVSQELSPNDNNPKDSEEAHKLETLLLEPHTSTTQKPNSSSTSYPQPTLDGDEQHMEAPDYSFQNDRLPVLSDDEFNNLSNDANPLHFLKQLTEPSNPQETKPETLPAAPIYITIPIYIHTSGSIPLRLTIGDQEVPLHAQRRSSMQKKTHSTKSPNSYFNRLLQQIDSPKRRATNRHRSQSRSKAQTLRKHNAAQRYKRRSFEKGTQ